MWPNGPRFTVVEVEGYRAEQVAGDCKGPGASVTVCDEAFNGRAIATFESERQHGPYLVKRRRARDKAHALALALNESSA